LDDRVYEEALTPRNDEDEHEDKKDEEKHESTHSGDADADKKDDAPSRPKRPRFELPADKNERKRSPEFLLTHNPDLDLGCDCLQLVQAYGTNRTKWKPKWNIERKEEQYRADLDVCIRDSADMVLVRGHWCDSERNAKRSAAIEGCKRLIEKGEKRNLMRLALMVGAWVYIAKYGDGADHDQAVNITTRAKEIMEKGEFKRGGERAEHKEEIVAEDGTKVVSRRNALDIVDNVFDQIWGEKRFIRRQPIYEVEKKDGGGGFSYKIVVTIPKFKGTFDEDTVVEGPLGDTILDARRSVAWELATKLHEKGKLPNHTLNENAAAPAPAASTTSAPKEQRDNKRGAPAASQARPGYSDRDRERVEVTASVTVATVVLTAVTIVALTAILIAMLTVEDADATLIQLMCALSLVADLALVLLSVMPRERIEMTTMPTTPSAARETKRLSSLILFDSLI
jgi:hypothetical protein